MQEGDTLTCRLYKGGKIEVTLEDRVYPDRSCGQYEAGWWVYCENEDFFLSESGILYDADYEKEYQGHTRPIGINPGLARRMREMA